MTSFAKGPLKVYHSSVLQCARGCSIKVVQTPDGFTTGTGDHVGCEEERPLDQPPSETRALTASIPNTPKHKNTKTQTQTQKTQTTKNRTPDPPTLLGGSIQNVAFMWENTLATLKYVEQLKRRTQGLSWLSLWTQHLLLVHNEEPEGGRGPRRGQGKSGAGGKAKGKAQMRSHSKPEAKQIRGGRWLSSEYQT